jgi:hypothetical protein
VTVLCSGLRALLHAELLVRLPLLLLAALIAWPDCVVLRAALTRLLTLRAARPGLIL